MPITNNTIYWMVIALLMFLLITFIVSSITKNFKTKHPKIHYITEPQKVISKERHEEVVDSLNWMLQNQIITSTEYNQLMIKCLPYMN